MSRRPASRAGRAAAWACAAALASGCAATGVNGYGPAFVRPPAPAAPVAASGSPSGEGAAIDSAAQHLALVRGMQERGLWYASLAHVDALELRWGPSDASRLLRADALVRTGQPDAAEPIYRGLLATPLAAAAHRGLARIATARGRPDEAARLLELARQRMPTDAGLLGDLGYALLQARQPERARVPLMQAAQLQAESADAAPRIFSNLAVYLVVSGRHEEARELMERRGMPPEVRQAVLREARGLAAGGAEADAPGAGNAAGATAPAAGPALPGAGDGAPPARFPPDAHGAERPGPSSPPPPPPPPPPAPPSPPGMRMPAP
ncbi:MAG: hypothetical protein PGN26_05015 [Xylophilus ampelinus]